MTVEEAVEALVNNKSKTIKKQILLAFDDDLLLEARRLLFKKGTTIQQFFTFVLHQLLQNDTATQQVLNDFSEFLLKENVSSEEKRKILKITAENLYSIFEEQDKKNQNNINQ